ncbi:hypothetical protein AAIR98_001539 [Elusimicrobium simillimum]|uniref:hypothetical protein n=1 Tax=Elusimicrobium simillimum TaxID=3143438 RepID=UPI003C6F2E12
MQNNSEAVDLYPDTANAGGSVASAPDPGAEKALDKTHVDQLSGKITETNNKINDLSGTLFKTKREIVKFRSSTIQGLGIFVAFITFISANVTIFPKVTSVTQGIVFMFLMLCAMIIFLYFLGLVLHRKTMVLKTKSIIILILVAAGVGTVGALAFFFLEKKFVNTFETSKLEELVKERVDKKIDGELDNIVAAVVEQYNMQNDAKTQFIVNKRNAELGIVIGDSVKKEFEKRDLQISQGRPRLTVKTSPNK